MSETVAVAVIRAEHTELDGTVLGGVLAAILADEVNHARFGWRTLGLLGPRLDDDARRRTGAWLVDAFAHQLAWELPRLPVHLGLRAEVARAGVCDGSEARAIFLRTCDEVIVPGLERAGLPAAAAWTEARREAAIA